MVPDTQPPITLPTRANTAPSAVFDPDQFAQLLRTQAQLEHRLASIEQALTFIASNQTSGRQEVMVNDVSMSFGSMVTFMVKWALASVPALIILAFLGWVALLFLGSMLAAAFR